MITHLRVRTRSRLPKALAVLAGAGIMVTSLPGLTGAGFAAPGNTAHFTTGKRCDEMHLGKKFPRTPANSGAPGSGQYDVHQGLPEEYFFGHDAKGFDALPPPTPQQKAQIKGTDKKSLDKEIADWDAKYAKSGDADDKAMAIYARHKRNQVTASRPTKDFKRWLKNKYITNQQNNHKGSAFERKTVKDFNMVGPDWLCEVTVEIRDKDGKLVARRKYDAYNQNKGQFGEFKSDGKYRRHQYKADEIILRHKDPVDPKKDFTKNKLVMYAGEKINNATRTNYRDLNKALQAEPGRAGNPVRIYQRQATGKGVFKQTKYTRSYPVMNPNPNKGSMGPINSAAFDSGKTFKEAKQYQREYIRANTRSALGRGPGGVDFSTLELQYVGNPVKGKGLDYSFKAGYMPDEDNTPGYGGQAKLRLASDAMFTWLALTPDKFWVNLNPDQPDKIMDPTFGKTDAGRVLLQADLQMKHDYARDMDPRKDPGKKYWDAMRAAGLPCGHSIRNWIVPKPAKVRVDENGIYILDAPLKVKSAPIDFTTPSPNGKCDLTKAQVQTSQRLVNQYILPDVEKKVNSSPEYKDLRRVYKSRVAAEYIRQQDKDRPSDFHPIINSNTVKRWPLRDANKNWTPRQTYDDYVKSFTKGDYSYPCEYNGQQKICIMGGVDFSKQPERKISRIRFQIEHPRLDTTTKTSVRAETSYRNTETAYLGGNGSGRLPDGGQPDPTPTPTPTKDPSTQPTTHTPAPSTPPTGGGEHPSVPPKAPDGSLPNTGSNTPVGLITGIAAALAAAGAALIWWMRRRKTAED
ncbi:LPXTG cell wall anchor domain-containing protein [Streptomyces sp. NPDC048434]|uniref:LPXTG cell wall anchor domain-containing protein n=1 Tax=Streptomyces sp. NPDC048434 TaxID=3365549 RepID=UPI00371641BF